MRTLRSLLVVSLLLPNAVFALVPPGPFPDVMFNHPNAEAIRYVKDQGIVSGYPDGTFRPNATINRAEFVKILVPASLPEGDADCGRTWDVGTDHPFTDVRKTDWFVHPVCRAYMEGLITGYPDGTFGPANQITFVEAAKILGRAFEGVDAFRWPPENMEWYVPYVQWLERKSAIPLSIARLNQPITRGEMAEMVWRLKAGVTDRPSKTYEDFASVESTKTRYAVLVPPSFTVKNYARNPVYRYSITAPANASAVIKSQNFTINGGRWTGPQLHIYSDAAFGNQIDTWASDDNWTGGDTARLNGVLTIPAGQARYVELSLDIGTPASMGFLVTVKHEQLSQVTLEGE